MRVDASDDDLGSCGRIVMTAVCSVYMVWDLLTFSLRMSGSCGRDSRARWRVYCLARRPRQARGHLIASGAECSCWPRANF